MAAHYEEQKKRKPGDEDYGTPVAGSKTEARGKLAHERVSREILELCCVIEENGCYMPKSAAAIAPSATPQHQRYHNLMT